MRISLLNGLRSGVCGRQILRAHGSIIDTPWRGSRATCRHSEGRCAQFIRRQSTVLCSSKDPLESCDRKISQRSFASNDKEARSPRDHDQLASIDHRESVTKAILDEDMCPVGYLDNDFVINGENALLSWVNETSPEGFQNSWSILKRLIQEQEAQHMIFKSKDAYYVRPFLVNRVVDCWRICWCAATLEIEPATMFNLLHELDVTPDNRALTMLIDALLKRGDALEAPLFAQWILDQRMEEADNDPDLRPDSFLLTSVIRAWSRSGRTEAPQMAEEILNLMHELYESSWHESGPNVVSYAATMDAWNRSRLPEAPQAMDRLLELMKKSSIPGLHPDSFIYSHVIDSWARTRTPTGAQKAAARLDEMVDAFEGGDSSIIPKASHFSRVIYALAKAGDAQRAEETFERLSALYRKTQHPSLKPDAATQRAMLMALTKRRHTQRAQDILDVMVKKAQMGEESMPNRSYFVDLLVAWTKEKNLRVAASQSDNLLRKMVDLGNSGFPKLMPDCLSFIKVARAWYQSREKNADERVESLYGLLEGLYRESGSASLKPNAKFVEVVISTLCRSSRTKSPLRAEKMIQAMELAYANGDTTMKPSRAVYTNLMQAWVRSRNLNHGAVQKLFDKLQIFCSQGSLDYCPDTMVYSCLMDSYAQCGDPIKTQAIFERMVEDYNKGNTLVQPDMRCFNIIMKAWSSSDIPTRAQKAEAAFRKIQRYRESTRIESLVPDGYTYGFMIRIFCDVSEEDAERGFHYFQAMTESGHEPSFSLYLDFLRLLLRSESGDTGIERATVVLEKMLTAVQSGKIAPPNTTNYRQFLEAVAGSCIPVRNLQARKLLDKNQHGKVPNFLLH